MSEPVRVTRIVPNLPVDGCGGGGPLLHRRSRPGRRDGHGRISTVVVPDSTTLQLSAISADASAPMTPVVSIGVQDVDAAHRRALEAGADVVYPLTGEPWGAWRFFFADSDGNVINVVGHRS